MEQDKSILPETSASDNDGRDANGGSGGDGAASFAAPRQQSAEEVFTEELLPDAPPDGGESVATVSDSSVDPRFLASFLEAIRQGIPAPLPEREAPFGVVEREILRLIESGACGVRFLCAPAGFGKTRLLRWTMEAARSRALPYAHFDWQVSGSAACGYPALVATWIERGWRTLLLPFLDRYADERFAELRRSVSPLLARLAEHLLWVRQQGGNIGHLVPAIEAWFRTANGRGAWSSGYGSMNRWLGRYGRPAADEAIGIFRSMAEFLTESGARPVLLIDEAEVIGGFYYGLFPALESMLCLINDSPGRWLVFIAGTPDMMRHINNYNALRSRLAWSPEDRSVRRMVWNLDNIDHDESLARARQLVLTAARLEYGADWPEWMPREECDLPPALRQLHPVLCGTPRALLQNVVRWIDESIARGAPLPVVWVDNPIAQTSEECAGETSAIDSATNVKDDSASSFVSVRSEQDGALVEKADADAMATSGNVALQWENLVEDEYVVSDAAAGAEKPLRYASEGTEDDAESLQKRSSVSADGTKVGWGGIVEAGRGIGRIFGFLKRRGDDGVDVPSNGIRAWLKQYGIKGGRSLLHSQWILAAQEGVVLSFEDRPDEMSAESYVFSDGCVVANWFQRSGPWRVLRFAVKAKNTEKQSRIQVLDKDLVADLPIRFLVSSVVDLALEARETVATVRRSLINTMFDYRFVPMAWAVDALVLNYRARHFKDGGPMLTESRWGESVWVPVWKAKEYGIALASPQVYGDYALLRCRDWISMTQPSA